VTWGERTGPTTSRRTTCRCRRSSSSTATPSPIPSATTTSTNTGDDNTWQDRRTATTALTWDITKRFHRNEVEFGFEHQWQSVQYVTIEDPWEPDESGLGGTHDLWTVHPWVGTLYARDQLDYEGFSANIGLRADYWFLGREAETAMASLQDTINITPETRAAFFNETHSFFGRRYKVRYSPRIIISHPISENSSFFFNYVKFTQNPSYRYVYSKINSVSSESFPLLGNLNLNPQVSINYEVGGRNQFSTVAAANATFFMKDIYDYPVSTLFTRTQGADLVPVLVYLNGHYARSLGFEVELEKRRGNSYWSGKVSYTYQQTRGKSSNPNEAKVAQQGDFSAAETRLSETYVSWKPSAQGVHQRGFRVPGSHAAGLGLAQADPRLDVHPGDDGQGLHAGLRSGRGRTVVGAVFEERSLPGHHGSPPEPRGARRRHTGGVRAPGSQRVRDEDHQSRGCGDRAGPGVGSGAVRSECLQRHGLHEAGGGGRSVQLRAGFALEGVA
jgi:hypothetical protein